MTTSQTASTVAFKGQHSLAVSPLEPYPQAGQVFDLDNRSSRTRSLMRIHGILSMIGSLSYDDVMIPIGKVEEDIVANDKFWKGDGVVITVPAIYDAAHISKAIGHHSVVSDAKIGKFYRGGVEFKDTTGRTLPPRPKL